MIRLFAICLTFTFLLAPAQAEDRGKVDGAIWTYSMHPVRKPKDVRRGAFRIEGSDIYQPRDMKPTKVGQILNKRREKPEEGDNVRVQFDGLRAKDGSILSFKGPITYKSPGKVTGLLTDADGRNWEFEAVRTQE